MRITDCRVNHLENPIGYRMERTVFSWKVRQANGKKQKYARVLVAEDPMYQCLLWDSGERNDLCSVACEAPISLKPRTRYFWKVQVVSDAGEIAQSDTNFFETGKQGEAWTAQWITCDHAETRHPIFVKTLQVRKQVETARLYICGLGLYEASIGGKKIGDDFLTPHCNNYDKWLQYQTYDVSDLIVDGAELSVLLGRGWYSGRFWKKKAPAQVEDRKPWQLIAELHIKYVDGSHEVIGTDTSWQVFRSNVTFSGIYDGEYRDDTLSPRAVEASVPGMDLTEKLSERMSLPIHAFKKWHPVTLIRTPDGEQVLDLGQNFAGIFSFKVHEPAGTEIRLQFGEILQNGNFFRENLRSAKAEYVYISGGEAVELMPHFTFYGYRYVKVSGVSELKQEAFTAIAMASAVTSTGLLRTGHPLVNQLISNTWWGLKSNTVDVPTDCPQRDERLGWTGDAQVFAETACYMEDMYAFYQKYLYDMSTEQLDGKVPNYIPSWGENGTSSVWGDAACIIPWVLYRFYGDPNILRSQYASMKAWVDCIHTIDGDTHGWSEHFHYGDWLALDNETGDPNENSGATDPGYIAQIYYMQSAGLVARAAQILGNTIDATHYSEMEKQIRAYIRREYFTATGRCCVSTQTALILALLHQLSDNPEWTRRRLKQMFYNRKDKLATGFVGTPLACPVLSENGMVDLAYKLLMNEEYPGWLYAVKLGATTIWERWNSVLPDGTISDTGMNSLNHYAYGSITQWIYQYAAGIRQSADSVGWRRACFAPNLNWDLQEVDGRVDTPMGTYRCSWKMLDGRHVQLDCSVPFGCEAELSIPDAVESTYADTHNPIFTSMEGQVCILAPGEYHLVYETTRSIKPEYNCSMPLATLLEQPTIKEMLLRKIPQISMIKTSMQAQPLDELLMTFAGYVGLPDRNTMHTSVFPELNVILKTL